MVDMTASTLLLKNSEQPFSVHVRKKWETDNIFVYKIAYYNVHKQRYNRLSYTI